MILDKVFFTVALLTLVFSIGGAHAQAAREKLSFGASGLHERGQPRTVTEKGFYNCPRDCIVKLKVMKGDKGCVLQLYSEAGAPFFYIDKDKSVKTITWKLETQEFEFSGEGKTGIQFRGSPILNISAEIKKITWTVNSDDFKGVPLILYDLNVKSCSGWGPGIINRG